MSKAIYAPWNTVTCVRCGCIFDSRSWEQRVTTVNGDTKHANCATPRERYDARRWARLQADEANMTDALNEVQP